MSDIESFFYPEKRVGGFTRYSGTVQFFQRVDALLQPGDTVLDFGAGRGVRHYDAGSPYTRRLRSLKGRCSRVVGVDIDPAIATNPSIDEAVVISAGDKLPFQDAAFDLILSDFVFEHIAEPTWAARELDRVLKPGGWLCVRTTNRNGYVAVANRIIPARLAKKILAGAQPERKDKDVFAAPYRMNTLAALKVLFPANRYEHTCFTVDAEPQYHFNVRFIFAMLILVHHITPPYFRNTLMCFVQKRPI